MPASTAATIPAVKARPKAMCAKRETQVAAAPAPVIANPYMQPSIGPDSTRPSCSSPLQSSAAIVALPFESSMLGRPLRPRNAALKRSSESRAILSRPGMGGSGMVTVGLYPIDVSVATLGGPSIAALDCVEPNRDSPKRHSSET